MFDINVDSNEVDNLLDNVGRASGHSIFVCRNDGILLYSNEKKISQNDQKSMGALVSGVWQAAEALSTFLPNYKNEDVYRLGFDTSSQGIYVLPLNIKQSTYYLGVIFYDEVNPGMIKSQIRNFGQKFINYIENKTYHNNEVKEDFLFKDITDHEIDQLFSFGE